MAPADNSEFPLPEGNDLGSTVFSRVLALQLKIDTRLLRIKKYLGHPAVRAEDNAGNWKNRQSVRKKGGRFHEDKLSAWAFDSF
jgi:hypothetical protein